MRSWRLGVNGSYTRRFTSGLSSFGSVFRLNLCLGFGLDLFYILTRLLYIFYPFFIPLNYALYPFIPLNYALYPFFIPLNSILSPFIVLPYILYPFFIPYIYALLDVVSHSISLKVVSLYKVLKITLLCLRDFCKSALYFVLYLPSLWPMFLKASSLQLSINSIFLIFSRKV